MMRLLPRKLRSFLALPVFMKVWLLPVYGLLGVARLAVLVAPFRKIAPLLGECKGTAAVVPLIRHSELERAILIGRTVVIAARYAPWDANCFAQAIVARIILGVFGIPYTIFFGLSREEGQDGHLSAHAWTTSGPVAVTGGYGFDRFTVVGTFTG
jgi:hypothetical protein